jgi:hypothetical protein
MSSTSILSSSVGKGGRAANRTADVRSVQHLFNLIDGSITLPETGTCNSALIARIARFQHDVLRYPHPDSRVDPNGRMIKANDAARTRRPTAAVAKQDEHGRIGRLGRGIDPLLVRALVQVGSNGSSGFGPDGLLLIAYEGTGFGG